MNIRNYIVAFLLILTVNFSHSQKVIEPGLVAWYTVEEADSLFKKNPKPIFIDVYTDWCGWCKHMMKTTFANQGIANYINTNFYPVKFNAEGFDTITYEGKTYLNNGSGKRAKHDFATYILKGKYSFPTIVYIDKKRNIFPVPGYFDVKDIESILVYFVEEVNYKTNYNEWLALYQFNYPERYKEEIAKTEKELIPDTSGNIKWMSFKDASEQNIKSAKPILIYIYTDWCLSCKITHGTVLKNKVLTDLINDKFLPVKFNAAGQEKITFFGQEFTGTGKNKPNKLTYALLQKNFKFPAYVFIDGKKQKIDELHGFFPPNQLESIFSYFSDGNYKAGNYNEFLKTFKSKMNN